MHEQEFLELNEQFECTKGLKNTWSVDCTISYLIVIQFYRECVVNPSP